MTAKKANQTNEANAANVFMDFVTLFEKDPTKAGLMLGYDLGRKLKEDLDQIKTSLFAIAIHLDVIRQHYEHQDEEKPPQAENAGTKIETLSSSETETRNRAPYGGPVSPGG